MPHEKVESPQSIIGRKKNQLPGEGPEKGAITLPGEPLQAFPEAGEQSFITSTLDVLVNWARGNSLWPLPFGTACCAIEFMSMVSSHYDIARFGFEVAINTTLRLNFRSY